MERLDGALRGALRGAGVPDAGALADVTRLWPAVVGDAIARASWPQRISRDGTLQVAASSSTWAFELGLLAEAELIGARRRVAPLLLLDDALSELDESRRRTLSERIGAMGQTIVTATGSEALPLAPAQLFRVTPGHVERG